jgi:predicted ATPase
MFISAVYIRFFRSFNFDYLRKSGEGFTAHPWDIVASDGLQYPFVKVTLEDGVTTVVGANESGKSQLLHALKGALTGKGIERGDFCRYSQYFAVNEAMAYPDFGLKFKDLDEADREAVRKACGGQGNDGFADFHLFRIGNREPVIYLPGSDGWTEHPVEDHKALQAVLPTWFEIDAETALPQSVPVQYLAGKQGSLRAGPRMGRQSLFKKLFENDDWFSTPETVAAAGPQLASAFSEARLPDEEHDKQLRLADDLLLKVAKIDQTAFEELLKAVDAGQDGFANSIVEKMNDELARALNFTKWWSQDDKFQLRMTLRDQDLVFTVRDRTGTEYSALERSGGLKYFLSYFVQYLAHEPPRSAAREVLLMDEPDAYLSSTGQQDLLRIFDDFAYPADPRRRGCQVVYVTHSPFLIDKNHSERIRVLEKGEGDEGTRVVRNVSRNHYEPLRSAFGSFVGETTFISNCNLMIEGTSDQILLAGMSARLRRQRTSSLDHLDLNTLTLVPTGSASHIPYMVYLARGRDVDRPAVIVLLDSDTAGNQARAALRRGPHGKPVIDDDLVVQLGELPGDQITSTRPGAVVEIEDLIPLEICVAAVQQYAAEFLGPQDAALLQSLTADDVTFGNATGTHKALQAAAAGRIEGFHLDKVGFAKGVIAVVAQLPKELEDAAALLDANFRTLFHTLGRLQRQALREIATEKTGSKIKRLRKSFLLDHPAGASREQAILLLEDIEATLDNSLDAEDLRSQIRAVQRSHELDNEPTEPISDFAAFRDQLESLAYREINAAQEPQAATGGA